ncbi:hypothetical protein Tco_0006692 [Tanacetum coccineum]
MRIDELYKKFSDSTLKRMLGLLIVIDILKRIGMKYCTDDTRDKVRQGQSRILGFRRLINSSRQKDHRGSGKICVGDRIRRYDLRHRYSNPMIQPELEGSTQGYPLDSIEVLREFIKMAMEVANPSIDSQIHTTSHTPTDKDLKDINEKLKYMFQDFRYSDIARPS